MGNDANDMVGFYDSRFYQGYDNISGSAFGSIFDECDVTDYSQEEQSAVHYVTLVIFPFLLLQGIIGNILAIPALLSISKSAWSTVLYLACLGGTDLFLLLVCCGDAWYEQVVKDSLNRRIIDSSDAACKTYHFAFMCVKHVNPWIMVAISVEMMIATRWPKRTYLTCTLERARNVLMLIGIIMVCLDINHFWTFGVPKPGFPCLYTEEFSENFKDWIWPAMDSAVEIILPLATVSVCLILTATSMIQLSSNEKRDVDAEMKNYFLELETLGDFRSVCFILCLVFMCINVGKIIYTIATLLSMLEYIEVDCSTFKICKTIDSTLTFLFYSAKIYLYVGFSSMFRAKLKEGFNDACRKLRRCCRIMCICGHKWTPKNRDTRSEDARMLPGPGIPDASDEGASRSRSADKLQASERSDIANPTNGRNDINKTAPSKSDTHKPIHRKADHSNYDPAETWDTSKETGHSPDGAINQKIPEVADKRPARAVKGRNQTAMTATKL